MALRVLAVEVAILSSELTILRTQISPGLISGEIRYSPDSCPRHKDKKKRQ